MAPTVSVVFILGCGLLLLLMATTGSTGGHVEAASSTTRMERNSTESFRRIARDRRRYCGKVLTDTLAMVCTSYPSPWRKKSVEPPSSSSSDEDSSAESSYREQLLAEIKQDLDELEQLSPEIFAAEKPTGQFHLFYPRGGHRRVRRQIVDECCRKSCTLKTLKQYCAD